MKSIFVLAAAALVTAGCAGSSDTVLETGDLIFVGIPADYSLGSDSAAGAIAEATGDGNELNLIHVAIAEVQDDSTWIIDATIKRGVDRHPLDTFLTDFTLRDGSCPVFRTMRLKDNSRAREFVANARKYLGQPYDSRFLPDNGAMYCSELVRESYVTEDGFIFSEAPMNFKDAEGKMPVYWEQLFSALGMEVPQGVNGTNPMQMSADPALREIDVDIVSR